MVARILGAVLAGGRSRRFGSDKATARVGARVLIDHALYGLAAQVDEVVLCGRSWPNRLSLADRPAPGLGPLGGLNAALRYALDHGFDAVLATPVDVYPLPVDLLARLIGDRPRTLLHQHAVSFWPARLAPLLDEHLASGALSMRAWIEASGADSHDDSEWNLRNINVTGDLPEQP